MSPRYHTDFEAIAAGICTHRRRAAVLEGGEQGKRLFPSVTLNSDFARTLSTRLTKITEKWGWHPRDSMRYFTTRGLIDLTSDSLAVIKRAAADGWSFDIASRDNRTRGRATWLKTQQKYEVVTKAHQELYCGTWARRAAAIGVLPSARELNRSVNIARQVSPTCDKCTEAVPTRRHFL